MAKSAYQSTMLSDYRITLTTDKNNDWSNYNWREVLDLQPMERFNCNVERFNNTEMIILKLSVLDDFNPHQINWKHIIGDTDVSVYVEDLDCFPFWKS